MTSPDAVHVLHVVFGLNPGGAERLVVDLATGLPAPHRATICCLDERGAWADEAEAGGVPVRVLGREPGFHPSLGGRIARLAGDTGAGVLHCHQYTPFVYGALARLRSPRLRLVFTEHGRLAGARVSGKRRLANALLGRMPGRFFAVCEELRGFMIREGFPPGRLGVLYNGIDPGPPAPPDARDRARRDWELPEDAWVVGSVARLDPVKDLATLVRAFARLQGAPPPYLVVVGDGPERAALEAEARTAGLGDRIRFAGQRSDVRERLPAFDVFVNSSTYEGVSLTIIEAMAAGLPVVATRVGGTPEVVTDGRDGRLVTAGDPAGLAAALEELRGDRALAARLGGAGRATVEARFRFDSMLQAYLDAYRNRRGD